MSAPKKKPPAPNYGQARFRLDRTDITVAQELGLLRDDLRIEEDASSAIFGCVISRKDIGVDTYGTQKAIQARWREFGHRCGFQLYLKGNSSNPNGNGNAKFACKKLHGQQFFDADGDQATLQCPFVVNVSSSDGNWKTTSVNLCHNHVKFVGTTRMPHPDSDVVAQPTELRNHTHNQADLAATVVRELLPLHANSTKSITGKAVSTFLLTKGVEISPSAVSRLKSTIVDSLHGDLLENYQKLESYFRLMAEKNPGSLWRVEKTAQGMFSRACFLPSIGLHIVKSARRLIESDGAHLKEEMNKRGVYLVATCKDHDSHITPFGLAIVPVENFENWQWFLEIVKEGFGELTRFTVVSDRQKGLLSAVQLTFPEAGHRFCLVHIVANIRSKGITLTNDEHALVIKMATADCESDYELFRSELAGSRIKAVEYLDKLEQEHWVKYQFHDKFNLPTYNETTSNLSEQANRWIGDECRSSKPLDAFSIFFRRLNVMISERRVLAAKWLRAGSADDLVPSLAEKLHDLLEGSAKCSGTSCMDKSWDIQFFGKTRPGYIHPRRIVDLEIKECTCGNWADQAFPCVHAVKAATLQGMPLSEMYDAKAMSIGTFQSTYSLRFRPWPTNVNLERDRTLLIPFLEVRPEDRGKRGKKPGPKPKNKRFKSKNGT